MSTEIVPGESRSSRGRPLSKPNIIRTDGPYRIQDDGEHDDELPDGRDFIGFAEGHA